MPNKTGNRLLIPLSAPARVQVTSSIPRGRSVLIDAADAPLAAEHAVVGDVLVDTVAKSGWAHLERHVGAWAVAFDINSGQTASTTSGKPFARVVCLAWSADGCQRNRGGP